LDVLKAEIKLPIAIANADLIGKEVTFIPESRLGHERVYRGIVRFIHPETNPVDATARVWIEVANEDLVLRPGMSGMVSLGATKDSDP
jgi:hypothetical protein